MLKQKNPGAWLICLLGVLVTGPGCAGDFQDNADVQVFIDGMVKQHQFNRQELETLFSKAEKREDILEAISRPAEKTKPWYEYRKIFVKPKRIEGGVKFWKENVDILERAAQQYSVDPAIIVAIIGVETRYGANTGSYRVIDALSTLAFAYPPRSKFFRSELEQFLILAREEDVNTRTAKGSYAGAMGYGQFIPSSYRNYAVDFNGDGKRDLWNSLDDIIGSVANYFHRHGWQAGEPVANKVTSSASIKAMQVSEKLKPGKKTAGDFAREGITSTPSLPDDQPVALLELEQNDGTEHWLTSNNFYVITRYNRSPLYSMAVYQLSEAIQDVYQHSQP
ncbi:MAG: lytic murein transglycosylase B [Gammaproteobacteria bacterium]|nr:MAG: lytic murein transglycosylase B [Gammaproteobacteria bacterium]